MNNPNEPQRVLIIQTAFLGDIVLTIPLIRALKKYKPGAALLLLTTPVGKSLLEGQHGIDTILVYDKKGADHGIRGFVRTVREIRRQSVDTVLSPHRSFRSGLIALFSGARQRIGYNLLHLVPFYNIRVDRKKTGHEIDRILSLLKPLSLEVSGDDRYPALQAATAVRHDRLIGIAPGSVWGTKQWTEEGYTRLVQMLHAQGYEIVLIGSEEDTAVAGRIQRAAGIPLDNRAGRTNLRQLADLLAGLRLLITNDNGAMQVAQALNTPIAALFGPTVPEQGFAPIRPNTVVIESKGLYCRPCSAHGPRECPEGHFLCMKSITPEAVFKTVQEMLQ